MIDAYLNAEAEMEDESITCCFTGHRPNKLPWGANESDPRCAALRMELAARLEGLYLSGFRVFLCGMAIGCDMLFAEEVLRLREQHPEISLEAAIPCGTQPDKWRVADRRRYNRLLDRCDRVKVLQVDYTPDCMLKRNRYMIERSSLLLACFNGSPGGTMNTILLAERKGIRMLLIDI